MGLTINGSPSGPIDSRLAANPRKRDSLSIRRRWAYHRLAGDRAGLSGGYDPNDKGRARLADTHTPVEPAEYKADQAGYGVTTFHPTFLLERLGASEAWQCN